VANPRVVVSYEPPHGIGYRFEGNGFPFPHLVCAVARLLHELLALDEADYGTGVAPASVTFEWGAAAGKVHTSSDGYTPVPLLVNALTLLQADVLGRQVLRHHAEEARRLTEGVQPATPGMVPPPPGKRLIT
jgi:hypothetical protein